MSNIFVRSSLGIMPFDSWYYKMRLKQLNRGDNKMNNIKIVEGLEPWEVMKRASEGELWVARNDDDHDWIKVKDQSILSLLTNMLHVNVAIIDTTEPVIDWGKFDHAFFHQYGASFKKPLPIPGMYGLHSSPFYYWPGGECPVPDNVEVEVVFRNGEPNMVGEARDVHWWNKGEVLTDIIAFRLTGNVL